MPISALNALSRCPVCRTNRSTAVGCCESCQQGLFVPRMSEETLILGAYGGRLEQAIRAYKFHSATRLGTLFASELAAQVRRNRWHIDAVCPVPLHTLRFLQRGYNQAAVLAKGVARELGTPYLPALTRVRRTRQQARLSRAERFENVRAAFRAVAPEKLRGKHLLLVDDVITSGATTTVCKEILLSAGAASVKLAAVAGAPGRL